MHPNLINGLDKLKTGLKDFAKMLKESIRHIIWAIGISSLEIRVRNCVRHGWVSGWIESVRLIHGRVRGWGDRRRQALTGQILEMIPMNRRPGGTEESDQTP